MPSPYAKAERHLARKSPIFKKIIKRVGPCTFQPNPDYFTVLVKTIVSQQLSTKAALSISSRLHQALGDRGMTPKAIQALSDEVIRGCGLSGGKLRALRDVSARALDGSLPLNQLDDLTDEELTDCLLAVHGIGPWSVDMFLIFSMGRPDILPVGDFGLRAAVQEHYELPELPTPKILQELAEPWRPYRTIATWYCWRSRGPVPQSK
jgi:DNA-3-methyladenine glycosylase II